MLGLDTKKIKTGIAALSLCVGFLAIPSAYAEEIELVTNMDFPPFITDEIASGGLFTELVRASFAEVGVTLKLRLMPWKRAHRALEIGEITGTFSWAHTKEREEKFLLSRPMFRSEAVFVSRVENFKYPDTFHEKHSEGKSLVLCSPLGWTLPAFAEEMKSKGVLEVALPPSIESCFRMIFTGRVDIVFVQRLALGSNIRILLAEGIRPGPLFFYSAPDDIYFGNTHILFARTHAGEKAKALYDKGFEALVKNGRYLDIISPYLVGLPIEMQKDIKAGLSDIGVLHDGQEE
ncbi:transporter substrate-binding domain-containing protein [Kordiimonas sp. SCSIO 12603]|uniref:substrate-binding periplasmic protein n=1 Tax=Kordiimonas sp. SCSIO 12603 TaxID=2829596 RepID=UPI002103D651|nr:transporter substrate-binding domain-containing protein [Kordiimonas sp. SCSIO 12603]UTW58432.1 transporter substrate-binding domain-containing protein [Kordiimonas sp. SCSIO 12603]